MRQVIYESCPNCGGTGDLGKEDCPKCNGSGNKSTGFYFDTKEESEKVKPQDKKEGKKAY